MNVHVDFYKNPLGGSIVSARGESLREALTDAYTQLEKEHDGLHCAKLEIAQFLDVKPIEECVQEAVLRQLKKQKGEQDEVQD